jgi:hypothetical protein
MGRHAHKPIDNTRTSVLTTPLRQGTKNDNINQLSMMIMLRSVMLLAQMMMMMTLTIILMSAIAIMLVSMMNDDGCADVYEYDDNCRRRTSAKL